MNVKKITSLLCTLAIVCTMAVSVCAQEVTSSRIVSAKTPTSSTMVEQKWANQYTSKSVYGDMNACGTPLTVGNNLYVTDNRGKLLKLNAQTGETIQSVDCQNIPPYFSQIAYGDDKIFVPQQTDKAVVISAYDADTLALVWKSNEISSENGNLQIAAPVIYDNHRIYFGTYVQDTKTYAYTSGSFLSMNTADGSIVWKYDNKTSGYYWASATIGSNSVFFGDTAGNLVSHSLIDNTVYATVSVGGGIYSTPFYSNGKVFVSAKNGNVVSIPVNADGTFNDSAKLVTKIGNNLTSSPVVYNGRVYVAGGGFGSTTPFTVLNENNLSIVYQIKEILSQSTPLISTAYATDTNKQQVYIYVTNYFDGKTDPATYQSTFNAGSSCTYLIKDSIGQTTPSYEKLANVSVPQSCTQSINASDAGWLYYYNDSGNLFALAPVTKKVEVKPSDKTTTTTPVTPTKTAPEKTKNTQTGDTPIAILLFGATALSGAALIVSRKKK